MLLRLGDAARLRPAAVSDKHQLATDSVIQVFVLWTGGRGERCLTAQCRIIENAACAKAFERPELRGTHPRVWKRVYSESASSVFDLLGRNRWFLSGFPNQMFLIWTPRSWN